MSRGNGRNSRQRRALNTIWTAAGDYGFQPEFMAFHRDGSPDLYLNSIVGFVHRHYDAEKLSAYAHGFDDSLLRDLFTDILWLGLEQAAYEFVQFYGNGGEMHQEDKRIVAKLIESVVFTEEKMKLLGIPAGTLPVGWWIGFQVQDEDVWEKVKDGTYSMFSIEGEAERIEVGEEDQ